MKKPLTNTIKYFYGIAELGYGLANNVELYFFTFFMTSIAKFSLGTVALVGTVSAVANIILTPFYGMIIEKSKPMRWGKLRSWMVIMPPLSALCFALEFSRIGSSAAIAAIFVVIGTIMFDQTYSLASVAHASLVNYIANDANERSLISGHRGTFQSLASILNSYLGAPLAALFATWVGMTYGYTLMAFTLCLLMTITFWITVKMTKGYEPTGAESQNEHVKIEREERIKIKDMLNAARRNKSMFALIIADFLRYLGNNVLIAAVTYYFAYVAKNTALMATYLLCGGIVQVIGSYLSSSLTKKLSTRTAAVITMLSVGTLELICRFVGFNVVVTFAILMIYRLCHGLGISLFPALIADCAAYDEWKNGSSVPFTIGVIGVAPKLASLVRSWVIPAVLAIVGFSASINPVTASHEVQIGVLNMFMLIPGCITIASGFILMFFYNLTKDKLDAIGIAE